MKYYQIVIIVCLWAGILQNKATAQNYIPLAQDSAVWFYEAQEGVFAPIERFIFFTNGDTVINNYSYKKIYFKAENKTEIKLVAGIRDDVATRKVYGMLFTSDLGFGLSMNPFCPLNFDIQWYDFEANLHQFISNTCNEAGTVSDTSTQLIYEENRRVMEYSELGQVWYEGIGSIYGLFNPLTSLKDYHLTNYCIGGFEACNVELFLDTDFIPINQLGKIFPNPAYSFFTLELTKEFYSAQVVISDIFGQIVYFENFNGKKQRINTSTLASGVYFVEVFNEGVLAFKDKLMVL